MGIHHNYHSKKHRNSSSIHLIDLSIPSTSNFLYDKTESVWNNPSELDLLNMKKAPIMLPISENCFLKVLPCIRRLYTIFNSMCPNLYRIHCPDSLRILQEIICLMEQYFHFKLSKTISCNELLHNENIFDDFINEIRLLSSSYYYPDRPVSSPNIEIRCFGQGIQSYDICNKLNQTILFCFELKTSLEYKSLAPIDVIILDPNGIIVPNDTKYINTYDQGYTKLFSCSYTPTTQAGNYNISFFYKQIPLSNESFTVLIKNSDDENDSSSINDTKILNDQGIPDYELEGEGCSSKVIVNSITRFRLRIVSKSNSHSKSIIDAFSVSILDPYGHSIVVQRRMLANDLLELTYQPMSIGEHQLLISFHDKLHRERAINVINDEMNELSTLKPFGPGLHRAVVGLPTEFYVDLSQHIRTNPTINYNHIEFSLEPSYQAEIDYEQKLATVRYTPLMKGDCPINILERNKNIPHSPFVANVKDANISTTRTCIHVKNLPSQIVVHRPIEFQVTVDPPIDGIPDILNVEIITDETAPRVSIEQLNKSLYTCAFIPTTLGRHLISIDYAGIVPENNPFYCHSIQDKDIQLSGPAMNNQCLNLNEPTHFYFKLNDYLQDSSKENQTTYESGYSSNEDTSLNTSFENTTRDVNHQPQNYRVTITDGHGRIKPNLSVKESHDDTNDNIRVDFTPDEQILYINISCTW